MTAPVRDGGRFDLPTGGRVVWTVAEGRRGRRWRWVMTDPRGTLAVLLETDPAGRPARLEVASEAGLLVLHPESDGMEAHGNVVGPDGVRPLAWGWGPDHGFEVVDLPAVLGACGHGAGDRGSAGVGRPVLRVDRRLRVVEAHAVAGEGSGPSGPPDGFRWPLE